MFELLQKTEATLTTFTGRTERHGKSTVPAVSFRLKFTGCIVLAVALAACELHADVHSEPNAGHAGAGADRLSWSEIVSTSPDQWGVVCYRRPAVASLSCVRVCSRTPGPDSVPNCPR